MLRLIYVVIHAIWVFFKYAAKRAETKEDMPAAIKQEAKEMFHDTTLGAFERKK